MSSQHVARYLRWMVENQIAVVAALAAAVGGLLVLWCMVAMRFWESGKPAERSEWMDR